jgi:hypothetical protein
MLRAYFDRNVFSALSEHEGGVTPADVDRIRQAVQSELLTILGSLPLFEETITTVGCPDDMYLRHMATVLELVNKHRMIKLAQKLILDDCYDYAVGLAENDRTMTFPPWLKEVFDASRNRARLHDLAQHVKQYRRESAGGITDGLLQARAEGFRRKVGTPDNFDELWDGIAESTVLFWVNVCPPEIKRKCHKRGIKRMLKIKSIRFFALYYLSVVYTGWFGLQGKPRKVKHGDIGDWFHAVSASAANIFVTLESKTKPGHLGYVLSLKPTPGFEVLSLAEFLERV